MQSFTVNVAIDIPQGAFQHSSLRNKPRLSSHSLKYTFTIHYREVVKEFHCKTIIALALASVCRNTSLSLERNKLAARKAIRRAINSKQEQRAS